MYTCMPLYNCTPLYNYATVQLYISLQLYTNVQLYATEQLHTTLKLYTKFFLALGAAPERMGVSPTTGGHHKLVAITAQCTGRPSTGNGLL